MSTNEMFIKAKLARNALTTKTREDGTRFVCQKDDAPDWVNDLCREAHDDMLPDDFVYSVIEESIDAIVDNEGDADEAEMTVMEADSYTKNLIDWVGSNLKRVGYCDEAISQYGLDASEGLVNILSAGQSHERQAIFNNVRNALENLDLEEMDGAE